MSDLDELLEEELKDPEFAKAWEETEIEYEIKTMLIKARLENNMTQKELSEKSGIRQSNISRIEKGTCVPTIHTLCEIAKSYGKRIKIEMV